MSIKKRIRTVNSAFHYIRQVNRGYQPKWLTYISACHYLGLSPREALEVR